MNVRITHPDKPIFPEDAITKGDLIDYYQRIAPRMLPYLRQRPLAFERYPSGIGAHGFFQQQASDYFPDWIDTVTVTKEGGTVRHVLANNTDTLVYLANQSMVTPHAWLSRAGELDTPDQMIFDLDPGEAEFKAVVAAARCVKELLDRLKLPAFLKTTGSRGLHVVVPLKRRENYDEVRGFARLLAEVAAARSPEQWTLEQRKDKRRARVFIDTNRNAYGQTVASAFAVRARRRAPVSTPISWDELGTSSDRWTLRDVFAKLEAGPDPWKDFFRRACSLERARPALEEMHAALGISPQTQARRNARTRRRAA